MSKRTQYNISFTGVYGDMRKHGKDLLKEFRVSYNGSLVPGQTTHLVCDPTTLSSLLSAVAPSDKLRLALEADIPVVSYHWLVDSAAAGRMLPPSQYLVDFESSLPALTEASCTAGNDVSPVERLRSASDPHTSEGNAGFLAADSMLSPGLSLLVEAAAEKKAAEAGDDPYSLEDLPFPGGFSNYQQDNEIVDISFGSAGGGAAGFSSPGLGDSPGLPAIPEGDQEAADIDSGWDADQCYANLIAADFSNLKITKPRSRTRVQRSSLSRYAAWGAAALPLCTVLAGQASANKPNAKTLAAIRKTHGRATPFFFSSMLAKIGHAPQAQVEFRAGDLSHGVKIIYDTDTQTGQQIFAHVIIKSIYALAGQPDELWMEHHYMFTSDDMLDRPTWGQALKDEEPIEDEELLLSANVYHSPAYLIVGDFGVEMRSLDKEKQKKRAAGAGADGGGNKYFPLLTCSRAFDVASKRILPLRKALQDH